MSTKLPSYQWYPGDWRKDPGVQSCSLAARGLWRELLDLMHESGERGRLVLPSGRPPTAAQLARLVGTSEAEVMALIDELEAAGVCDRDGQGVICSRRMLRDEAARQAKSRAGKAHGLTSERARELGRKRHAANTPANTPADGERTGSEQVSGSSSSSSASSSSSPSGKKTKARAGSAVEPPAGFGEFWAAYPKKVDRAEAAKAWAKLAPGPDLVGAILAGLGLHKASRQWQKDGGEYVPHPATWLNRRRWEADPLPAPHPAAAPHPFAPAAGGVRLVPDGVPPEGMDPERAAGFAKLFADEDPTGLALAHSEGV